MTYADIETSRTPFVDSTNLFGQLSVILTQKVSQLFQTNVLILDEKGKIVAECQDEERLSTRLTQYRQAHEPALRIPFCIDGEAGELLVSEPDNDAVVLSRLLKTIVELVISDTTHNATHRAPDKNKIKNKFVCDLLLGNIVDERAIHEKAAAFNLDLQTPRAVLLIDARDYILPADDLSGLYFDSDAQAQHRAQAIIRTIVHYFHMPNDLVCAYLGDGHVAVLKAADSRNLAHWSENDDDMCPSSWADLAAIKRAANGLIAHLPGGPGRTFHIGIGRYHPGIGGFTKSYQDARTALSLGRRLGGGKRVYCLDELGIHAFVGVPDEKTKADLAYHLLSPLDGTPELLETLSVFLDSNSLPSEVAHKLHIHRNTVAYRLEKITQLTGLDPRHFDDAVQMRLALVLRSLQGNVRAGQT